MLARLLANPPVCPARKLRPSRIINVGVFFLRMYVSILLRTSLEVKEISAKCDITCGVIVARLACADGFDQRGVGELACRFTTTNTKAGRLVTQQRPAS